MSKEATSMREKINKFLEIFTRITKEESDFLESILKWDSETKAVVEKVLSWDIETQSAFMIAKKIFEEKDD